MRALLWTGASLAALALAFAYAHLRTDTYLGRWFAWRGSDVGDMLRFPSLAIAASSSPRPLPPPAESALLTQPVTVELAGRQQTLPLEELLDRSSTTAFVVLHGGQSVAEWYASGSPETARGEPVTSFSVAKSVTSLLISAALADGLIGSLDDPATRYLPELRGVDAAYDDVTLRHLLDMRSGVRFRDHDLPWGDKARVYYEPRLRELALSLPVVGEPGAAFKYNSYNSVLLGLVLERASGENVASFLERRLWEPLGAAYPASWSVSGPGATLPKMESGVNAAAIDFARLGHLLLEGGAVDGRQVMPAAWVGELLERDADSLVDAEAGLHYRLGWWLYSGDAERPSAVSAQGHLGQFVFAYPELDVVIARFGSAMGKVGSWRAVFDQVARAAAGQRN